MSIKDFPRATPSELEAILGPKWCICRKTEKNIARYGKCISHKEYREANIKAVSMRSK